MTCGFYWLYFNPFLMEIHYRQSTISNSLDQFMLHCLCVKWAHFVWLFYNGGFDQVYYWNYGSYGHQTWCGYSLIIPLYWSLLLVHLENKTCIIEVTTNLLPSNGHLLPHSSLTDSALGTLELLSSIVAERWRRQRRYYINVFAKSPRDIISSLLFLILKNSKACGIEHCGHVQNSNLEKKNTCKSSQKHYNNILKILKAWGIEHCSHM